MTCLPEPRVALTQAAMEISDPRFRRKPLLGKHRQRLIREVPVIIGEYLSHRTAVIGEERFAVWASA